MSSRNLGFAGRSIAVIALGLTLAACASLQTGSDFDHTVNMSGYHAFGWMPREHYGTHNPLVIQRARDAIQGSLAGKGFAYVEDSAKADFVVDFTIGAHDRTDIQTYPVPYAGPWYSGYYEKNSEEVSMRVWSLSRISAVVLKGPNRRFSHHIT